MMTPSQSVGGATADRDLARSPANLSLLISFSPDNTCFVDGHRRKSFHRAVFVKLLVLNDINSNRLDGIQSEGYIVGIVDLDSGNKYTSIFDPFFDQISVLFSQSN